MKKISANLTTAMFPNRKHEDVIQFLQKLKTKNNTQIENFYLNYINNYLQICPQTSNPIDEEKLQIYQSLGYKIRFHANLKLEHKVNEAYIYSDNIDYWTKMKPLIKKFNMDAYTIHSGKRVIPLEKVKDYQKKLTEFLEVPVGVEGLYPETRVGFSDNHWLISTWKEYQWLLHANIPYAIDCSHIQIMAFYEKKREYQLFQELLMNEKCIEIHISDNDFKRDNHQEIFKRPWWFALLQECLQKREKKELNNIVFCESQIKNSSILFNQ